MSDKTEHLYVVRYRFNGQIWTTVVTGLTIKGARRRFTRDNPDVELVDIV